MHYRGSKPTEPLRYLPLLPPLFLGSHSCQDVSTSVRLKSLSILYKTPHLHFFWVFCLFLWPCLEVGTILEPPGFWLPNLAIVSWLFILHFLTHGFRGAGFCSVNGLYRKRIYTISPVYFNRFAISPTDTDGMNFIPSMPKRNTPSLASVTKDEINVPIALRDKVAGVNI